jgi:hypothetical protein
MTFDEAPYLSVDDEPIAECLLSPFAAPRSRWAAWPGGDIRRRHVAGRLIGAAEARRGLPRGKPTAKASKALGRRPVWQSARNLSRHSAVHAMKPIRRTPK